MNGAPETVLPSHTSFELDELDRIRRATRPGPIASNIMSSALAAAVEVPLAHAVRAHSPRTRKPIAIAAIPNMRFFSSCTFLLNGASNC